LKDGTLAKPEVTVDFSWTWNDNMGDGYLELGYLEVTSVKLDDVTYTLDEFDDVIDPAQDSLEDIVYSHVVNTYSGDDLQNSLNKDIVDTADEESPEELEEDGDGGGDFSGGETGNDTNNTDGVNIPYGFYNKWTNWLGNQSKRRKDKKIKEGIEDYDNQVADYAEFGLDMEKEIGRLESDDYELPNSSKLFVDSTGPSMFKYYAWIPIYPDSDQKSTTISTRKQPKAPTFGDFGRDTNWDDDNNQTINSDTDSYGMLVYGDSVYLTNKNDEESHFTWDVSQVVRNLDGKSSLKANAIIVGSKTTPGDIKTLTLKDYENNELNFVRGYTDDSLWLSKEAYISKCKEEFDLFIEAISKDFDYVTSKFDYKEFGFSDAEDGLNKIIRNLKKQLPIAMREAGKKYSEIKRDTLNKQKAIKSNAR
jgi:hypothetical protein